MKKLLLASTLALCAATAWSKIPAPVLSDDAKAKAAEAAAKTAHGNALANFQLCKSMDATAASYAKSAKAAGKEVKPPTPTPACADPGAFVYPPPAPGAAPVVAAAAAKPGTPAAAAAAAVKAAAPGAKPAVPAAPPKKS